MTTLFAEFLLPLLRGGPLREVYLVKKQQACIVVIGPLFRGWPFVRVATIQWVHCIGCSNILISVRALGKKCLE